MQYPLQKCERKEFNPQCNLELDGLRSIALLSELLFYANIIVGGFLGVDVFFFISWCVITRSILLKKNNGEFHFKHFLSKRVLGLFLHYC